MINAMETSGTSPSNTSNLCATSGTSPSGASSPAVSIQPEAPNTPTPYSTQAAYLASVTADVTASITAAHEKFALAEKAFARDYGIAYGKVLFLARKKLADAGYGQLSRLLDNLSIPRSTAYAWIERYEISVGVKTAPVVPCEHCDQKFPSKTQLQKHLHLAHLDALMQQRAEKVQIQAEQIQAEQAQAEQTRVSRLHELEKAVETKTKEPFNSFRAAQAANAEYREMRKLSPNAELQYQLGRLLPAQCDGIQHTFIRAVEAALAEQGDKTKTVKLFREVIAQFQGFVREFDAQQ